MPNGVVCGNKLMVWYVQCCFVDAVVSFSRRRGGFGISFSGNYMTRAPIASGSEFILP